MLKHCVCFLLLLNYLRTTTAFQQCNTKKDLPPHLKIQEHILCDYDKTIRPVKHTNATALDIKFFVHHFDYMHGNIEVVSWFGMRWSDEHIHWDPDKFGNVDSILLSTDDIWTPDLYINNKGSYGRSKIIQDRAECIVSYYNKVICVAQSSLHGACTPDFRYYPFDVQNCTLKIGSWYHSGEEIDLADVDAYDGSRTANPEWNLESLKSEKDPGKYGKYPNETYPSIDFVFVLRRNGTAKFIMLIVPILVIIGMSILTLWLDPVSSERIYIITINIPAHVMFILNFNWELPENGNSLPYLLIIQRNSELIVLFTLIETVVVRYLLNKTKESPRFLVNIFTSLASNKIGQLLLFSELNPENAVENLTADDSSNLVEVTDRPKEWFLLGKVIDRVSFLGSCFVYFVMFIIYVHRN